MICGGVSFIYLIKSELVVFCVDFKIALWVVADGANLGSFFAYNNVTAVTAFPNLDFAPFENFCRRAYARWPRNFHLHWVMFGAPHNRAARLTLWRWISRFRLQTRPVFRHRGAIWPGSNGNYYRVRNTSPGRFPAA